MLVKVSCFTKPLIIWDLIANKVFTEDFLKMYDFEKSDDGFYHFSQDDFEELVESANIRSKIEFVFSKLPYEFKVKMISIQNKLMNDWEDEPLILLETTNRAQWEYLDSLGYWNEYDYAYWKHLGLDSDFCGAQL